MKYDAPHCNSLRLTVTVPVQKVRVTPWRRGGLFRIFPQCWYLWRHQIDVLIAAGYQVAAPDQRGYGGSDKPADVGAYNTGELVADAVGIADALGHKTFEKLPTYTAQGRPRISRSEKEFAIWALSGHLLRRTATSARVAIQSARLFELAALCVRIMRYPEVHDSHV
jgi:hypothetical protein